MERRASAVPLRQKPLAACAASYLLLFNPIAHATDFTTINIGSYLNGNLLINGQLDPVGLTTGNTGTSIPFMTTAYGSSGEMGSAFLQGRSSPGSSSTLTINLAGLNLNGQVTFYALLNNYYGTANANEYNVIINFTNGTSATYSSVGGVNTRDYNYNPSTTGTITSTTTNWWTDYATVGTNYQRLDVREFIIPTMDQNLTIANLQIVQVVSNDPAFLSGLTFSTLPPATFTNPTTPPTLTNIVTSSGNYLSAVGTSLNPEFDGGVLTATTGTTTSTPFSISSNGGSIDAGGKNLVFQGIFSNLGNSPGFLIVKNTGQGGQVLLAAVNTYTGLTTISSGTLALSGSGSIASSSGLLDSGVFDISAASGAVNLAALSGSGSVSLGANTLNLTNAAGTFAGAIGGTGGLTLSSGTQTLSGMNTFSGELTVDAGAVVSVASASALGTGTLELMGNSTVPASLHITGTTILSNPVELTGDPVINVDPGTTSTIAGVISDGGSPGTLDKEGTGDLVLTAANTYTGPTTLDAGTLEVDGSITSPVTVAAGATFMGSGTVFGPLLNNGLTAPGTSTSPGILTVSGNYTQGAAGTLALRVTPSTVAGTGFDQLNIGGAAALGGAIAIDNTSTAAYTSGQAFDLVHAVGGVGGTFADVNFVGTPFATDLEPELVYARNDVSLQFQDTHNPVYNTPSATTTTVGGVITNGASTASLTKQGGGTLVLTGASTYTGPTTVAGGTLDLNGSITSPVTVNSGATLAGNGTVASSVTNNGSVTAGTGSAAGTLTATGNYTQSGGASLSSRIAVSSSNGSSANQLNIGGIASLNGTLAINNMTAAGYKIGQAFDLIHSTVGVSGTFSQINYVGAGFAPYLAPQIDYGSHDVYLTLAPQPAVVNSGRVSVANSFVQDQSLFEVAEAAMTGGDPLGVEGIAPRRDAWVHVLGSYGAANGYDTRSDGLVAGQGVAVSSEWTVGGAVSALWTNTGDRLANVGGTTVGINGYGIYDNGNVQGSIAAGFGHLENQLSRNLPEFTAAARGENSGTYALAGLHLGYRMSHAAWFAVPDIEATYLHTRLGASNDNGAGVLDLHYARVDTDLGRTAAGVTGGLRLNRTFGAVIPWMRIGLNGSLGQRLVENTETIGLSTSTQTAIAAPTAALATGAGVDVVGSEAWRVSARWTGDFGGGTRSENFALDVHYRW